jgi:hypothetical protein
MRTEIQKQKFPLESVLDRKTLKTDELIRDLVWEGRAYNKKIKGVGEDMALSQVELLL